MDTLELGRYLREIRESKERTLDDAVRDLHIRKTVLESFEQGQFTSDAMSDIQLRGMLRNYVLWLEQDADQILDLYTLALNPPKQSRWRKRKTQETNIPLVNEQPRRVTDTPPAIPTVNLSDQREGRGRRILITILGLFATISAIAVIIFVTVEFLRTPIDEQNVAIVPTNSGIIGNLPPTSTFTPTWTPRPDLPTSTPIPVFVGGGVNIVAEIIQRTFIRVSVDDVEQFSGIVTPGERLEYQGISSVTLTVANAAGIEIQFNGIEQATFGLRGQRVDITFTTTSVDVVSGQSLEPTPIASPTPLPLPTSGAATAILALTPTEGPSPTPTQSPTNTPTVPATDTPTNTPTITLTPSETPIPSETPLPTNTPTITPTPTITQTPSPTAILPPRITSTPDGTEK